MKSSVWVLSAVKWIVLGSLLFAAVTETALAQTPQSPQTPTVQPWQKDGWLIRLYGVGAYSDDDDEGIFDWDTAGGIGFNGAYRVNRRFSVELSTAILGESDDQWHWRIVRDEDGEIIVRDYPDHDDDFFMIPNMFSFNFHLTPDSRLDFHAGPSVGFVHFGEFDRVIDEYDADHPYDRDYRVYRVDGETSAALGWNIGLDIPLGRSQKWAIYTSLQGFVADTDEEVFNETWFMGKVGVGYKF
ncbi:hypothetical protein [Acanthopleuribacter pedis]|uniref:Outer membrane protein beta-barrel domain-containing protein n=1 Tax=Acanthopleuribacter pedis TaxID=442870 RepID=A0A8J7QFY2_9BACT|nr:hypothetical protein [Acanthopleuribacter pedis]MBO1323434.1 hypothetical protein [Acanthopleuribacter pedis]